MIEMKIRSLLFYFKVAFFLTGTLLFLTLTFIAGAVYLKANKIADETKEYIAKKVEPKVANILTNVEATTSSTQKASDRFENYFTDDVMDAIRNDFSVSAGSAQQTATSSAGLADTISSSFNHHINPLIDTYNTEGKSVLSALAGQVTLLQTLTQEMTRQVKQNGDSFNTVLTTFNATIVQSREEALRLIKETANAAHGVSVITNDSEIAEGIHSAAGSMKNVEVITGELAELSKHTIEPIVNPPAPKNGFDKFFVRPTLKVLKFVSGVGNVFYIVGRF
jgi:hypothetical protein